MPGRAADLARNLENLKNSAGCGLPRPGLPPRAPPGTQLALPPSGGGGGFNVSSPALLPALGGDLAGWSARGFCPPTYKPTCQSNWWPKPKKQM